ncbi:hypothetical protein [Iodidimonas sp. SYSU 1G8]|uniref:hypothetical protein n=1 Tax=Iodidimonas sp. SYSU 1G8 TaxID=3133967 RepID=UPI0031FEC811
MTFKAYIRGRRRGASPDDDFLDHAKQDPAMPDVACWSELRDYLLSCGAWPGAIESARAVWLRYRRQVKRDGEPERLARAA